MKTRFGFAYFESHLNPGLCLVPTLLLAGLCLRASAGDPAPSPVAANSAPPVPSSIALPSSRSIEDTFRRALVEEEMSQNLAAAIQAYREVIVSLDASRQMEATALFRLGDCYRKEGSTNEALAQYQRVLTDFSDQITIVKLSRAALRNLGSTQASPALVEANHPANVRPGEPRPVAAWSFAQTDGDFVPDASGHGYDAQIHGHPRLVPRWGGSQALEFDGSGHGDTRGPSSRELADVGPSSVGPSVTPLPGGRESNAFWKGGPQDSGLSVGKRLNRGFSELSVEAWLRKTPAWWMPILYRDLWDQPFGFGLYAEWNAGKVVFGHYDPGIGHGSGVQSESTVQDGRWHYVVGTIKPAAEHGYQYRIYVDGQLDAEQTGTWGVEEAPPEGGILKIAYPNASGADQPYQGALDSIAIFDVALTPAQVKARFEASREPPAR